MISATNFRYFIRQLMRIGSVGILSFWSVFLLWNYFFGFWIVYLTLLSGGIISIYVKRSFFSGRLVLFQITLYLLMLPLTLRQYQQNSVFMYRKIQDGQSLRLSEKCSIYGLNIIICCLAYPFYPEISKESFLMCFPVESGQRIFYDDFFLQSAKVQDALLTGRKRVKWSINEYVLGKKEARYALALNPCSLTTIPISQKKVHKVEVNIHYPENSEVVLLDFPVRVTLQEGLFAYLQRIGWLYPYRAIWISDELYK